MASEDTPVSVSRTDVRRLAESQTLGGDAVIARSRSGLMGPPQWRGSGVVAAQYSTLNDKPIVTITERRVGAIKDVLINEQTGGVDALEMVARDVGGLLTRRKVLPVSSEIAMGETSW